MRWVKIFVFCLAIGLSPAAGAQAMILQGFSTQFTLAYMYFAVWLMALTPLRQSGISRLTHIIASLWLIGPYFFVINSLEFAPSLKWYWPNGLIVAVTISFLWTFVLWLLLPLVKPNAI